MKIKCHNCEKTVAKVTETGLLRVTMKGRKVLVTGRDYNSVVSCSFCRQDTVVMVEAGRLVQDGLKLEKDDEIAPIEGDNPTNKKETPPESPNPPEEEEDDESEE
jgi:hypothetical protein